MAQATPSKGAREISSIGFPYLALDDVMTVARLMLDAGGVPMDRDQLASALGHLPTGGAFANKVSAARMFGLLDYDNGRYQLSPLGFDILDSARERAAKVQAFYNVPLYKKAYDTYRGRQLPPKPAGLEQAFVSFGVSPKQRENARRAFEKSARVAGMFPTPAEDRLVEPVIGPTQLSAVVDGPMEPELARAVERPSAPAPVSAVPPFMAWLIDTLPEPGTAWDRDAQADWLRVVAQTFRVVYKAEGAEAITINVTGAAARSNGGETA